jgi:threonyl-tRNA synthetase
MPVIKLPDGRELTFNAPIAVADVAASISSGLAKAALAVEVDGVLVDLSYVLEQDSLLRIITAKDAEGLDVIRHSCAHLMAQAVQSIFPGAQVTIGPVIENGFYYDFAYKEHSFTPEDLLVIENKMQELVDADLQVKRFVLSRNDAIQLFTQKGEKYKVEIINSIPGNEDLSFYQQGDFIDLCRGPHVPSTGKLKVFKLMKISGAYWRGDAKNEMLQRIYGTAWGSKEELKLYLRQLEEAEKRDHRKLAQKLNLFNFHAESPGMVFWQPHGWTIYRIMENYIRSIQQKYGYQEVKTPQLLDHSLWAKSGHWEKFRENMFVFSDGDTQHALKPMSCPCHVEIFNIGIKSYRDLPFRLAEFGSCHRNEPSGTLHGLMRVRHLVQDDGHIFCTEAQIQSEVSLFIKSLFEVYRDFGFDEITIFLATRPEKRIGAEESWEVAENALKEALNGAGLEYKLLPGEGAFYGPKIEFHLKDCIGRMWQCGTIQVDFFIPDRLAAHYVAEDGSRKIPVMLHRAVLGTIERFMGILLEDTAGSLPVWLSPVQAVVMNITDKHAGYVTGITNKLREMSFRVEQDLRNEKIGFKIREHTIQRVPFLLVVGDREMNEQRVAVRTREGVDLGSMSINDFVKKLSSEEQQFRRKQILDQ